MNSPSRSKTTSTRIFIPDFDRYYFYKSGFNECQSCFTNCPGNICKYKDIYGQDPDNGNEYGRSFFACKHCKWMTYFDFDEGRELYYFETLDMIENKGIYTPSPEFEAAREQRKKSVKSSTPDSSPTSVAKVQGNYSP